MGTEIEVKVRVASHAAVRERLVALGAVCLGGTWETNTFFDAPGPGGGGRLRAADCGLRVRRNVRAGRADELVVTYKGPKMGGAGAAFKTREEIEVVVDDYDNLVAMFSRLGYDITLSFEKKRETWRLGGGTAVTGGATAVTGGATSVTGGAEVVLDELPHGIGGGTFVEVEAGSEGTVSEVLGKLGLGSDPAAVVKESYIQLVAEWAEKHGAGTVVRF